MFPCRTAGILAASAHGLAALALAGCATVRDRPLAVVETRTPVALALANRHGPPAAYNSAVAGVAETLNRLMPGPNADTVAIREGSQSFQVKIATAPDSPWSIPDIETIRPAETLRRRGLREQVRQEGLGAPVILKLSSAPEPARPFAPPTGLFVPATALVEPAPGGAVTFSLADPLGPGFSGGSLAADYSAGLDATFAKWYRKPINLPAMLRAEPFEEQFGLVNLDSVYPGKIPVVFVHGLKSSSGVWKDTINELRRHPAIRERFEFWVFGYGTGAPLPYSAMLLRDALQDMAEYRTSLGAASADAILVGHSMGGLLSRIMTTSSGDENWFLFFSKPVEELDVPQEKRLLLQDVAYYDSLPFVKRVVFVATPHGGSEFAENFVGRLGSELIRLPANLLFLSGAILQTGIDALTPFGQQVMNRMPTSIDLLKPESAFLQRLADVPLNPGVTYHSIIGNRGKDLGDRSSDGIVSYRSAHLEGVASEKIVPVGHDAYRHPEAVAELQRILLEHLGQ